MAIVSREAPVIPIAPPRPAPDLADRSDDELMTLAAAGLLAGFGELVHRYERQVRALCTKMLGSAAAGDDAAQEVFLDVWRTCPRYERRGHFRAFLFTAARNRCLKTRRSELPVTIPLEAGEAPTSVEAAPAQIEAILAAERRQQMDRLVSRLPPKLREAIWLRFAAELEYAEIAAILNRSEEAVRSRVFNGLRRLRDRLDESGRQTSGKDRSRR